MRRALLVLAFATAFGAAEQYLGSLSAHPWATSVSLLSAPWLLVAFFAGCTQAARKRAAVVGLLATYAALVGYWAMALSPVEGAHLTAQGVRGIVVSQALLVVGGLATGPLFGSLGHAWRKGDQWIGAFAAALALSLEPLAHAIAGSAIRFPAVWGVEVATVRTLRRTDPHPQPLNAL